MGIRRGLGAATTVGLLTACSPGSGGWDDYQQLLPRGEIAAITEPRYVSADDAEIDDDSFVLGVIVEGQALAYSLNLLNSHEVVNDRIGDTSFAAVW